MAKSFSTKEATVVYGNHRHMLSQLTNISEAPGNYVQKMHKQIEYCLDQEANKRLADMPIEEINRDKEGIRVGLLKDAGLENLGQLGRLSMRQIQTIKGIGEQSAYVISRELKEIKAEAVKNVQLRVNPDAKTKEASSLVYMYMVYKKAQTLETDAKALLDKYGASIAAALQDLMPATSSVNWFLTFGNKKRDAEGAYNYLVMKTAQGYDKQVLDLSVAYEKLNQLTYDDAWKFFQENTVDFFATMDQVYAGSFTARESDEDKYYGVPEDIAEQVQNISLYPQGFNATLRGYQEWGVKYILHQKKVLLGDEMGLGKTIQAIAAMVSLSNEGEKHFLVVCPASVLINWVKEIQKFSTLKTYTVHGRNAEDTFVDWLTGGGVAVTTYETTAKIRLIDEVSVGLLVVDEAHYIKNKETKRSENVRDMTKHSERILFMTGTAIENRVDEMVSLIDALNPQVAREIRNMSSMRQAPEFKLKVASVYLRRKREQVAGELPDLIEKEDWVELLDSERQVYYNSLCSRDLAAVRKVSWNMPDIALSSKGERLLEIIDMAAEEERKVIVFSFFKQVIEGVSELLKDRCVGVIDGSVTPEKRQELVDALSASPAGSVLVAQIQAGGTGLNIQAASVVILCEPQYKPSIENQAISRSYRMGQSRNVLVHRLLASDTFDERLMDILKQKQAVFDAFADESEAAEQLDVKESVLKDIIQEEITRLNKVYPEMAPAGGESETAVNGTTDAATSETAVNGTTDAATSETANAETAAANGTTDAATSENTNTETVAADEKPSIKKVLIAMDSFKGSLSSMEAGNAVAEGIKKAAPEIEVEVCPLADGGEGTVESLVTGLKGEYIKTPAIGPCGTPIMCTYGLIPELMTAVIEMSAAAGLPLVEEGKGSLTDTTTYGVGDLIKDAIRKDYRKFIIGIGGSGTNDGGVGMLMSLGFEFLDEAGDAIPLGAKGLKDLKTISAENVLPELSECEFRIACDVTNPLCGEEGCSKVFGPQKGATPEMIEEMDGWLSNYAKVAEQCLANNNAERFNPDYPGVGAAGGLGYAFRAFLGGDLERGTDIIIEETKLADKVKETDLVVTGEGRLDGQTVKGKAPIGIAELAKSFGKKTVAFAGRLGDGYEACLEKGLDECIAITDDSVGDEEAMKEAYATANLTKAAENYFKKLNAETEAGS